MTDRALHLADGLAAEILLAAGRAYPCECCGLIEGVATDDGWRALRVHETANRAEDPARHFLIDPQAQFDLLRALRETDRRIIGCFHSHPDGKAAPSATDRAQAWDHDFLWLIAGGSPQTSFALNAFRFVEGTGFCPLALASGDT